MSISKTYLSTEAENRWYPYWMEKGFFRSVPDEREPYTVVIPPPNVTGVLHMGHMLNNTIQDVLIRRARMMGKNALWVPGTDHASIATEAKVVALLAEKGIDKKSLTREEFLSYAYDWKDKYGGIILDQLKKLGASCDWERTTFTMDPAMSGAVIDTFIHLFEKGLIYRGIRMVNWDPKGLTAVSDEEVIRKEVNQKLFYIKYKISDGSGFVTIATTRPETIMADSAICVNPNDERYKHLHGKKILVPLINREIPIITDEYVTMDFGTGCLKVTPAHDLNDYELGIKHKLAVVDILNDNGTLNEKAEILVNEDRFIARKKIAVMLEEAGQLEKVEEYKSQVGFSERTDAVIEPKLSMQWFVRMEVLAKPALDAVNDGEVNLIPDKYINTYRHWMENVKDWCISRQLWWGQQIPAWYATNGEVVVAKTAEEAIEKFKALSADYHNISITDIRQDDDVVDTWFSSWLWPISVFDPTVFGDKNNKGNADLNYYYPTNDLVTAPEILFFWVARMIMAGKEFRNQVPFKNVYLTGIVRDKQGRKMSKSLGNSPDPIELMAKYGADGVRVGMLLCSPAGNDLMFDESYCEQGRNFANKIWNAFRLVKGWTVDASLKNENTTANEWFDARFNESLKEIEQMFLSYRLSEALMSIYKLIWDDFCSSYLEMIKPTYHKQENGDSYQDAIDAETFEFVKNKFAEILKLIHPFMPFLSEELWHDEELFGIRAEMDCCIVATYPTAKEFNEQRLSEMNAVLGIVSEMRNIRNAKQIAPKDALDLSIKNNSGVEYSKYELILKRLAMIGELAMVQTVPENATQFLSGNDECFVDLGDSIDPAVEKERMMKELVYLEGFLKSVDAKLSNERFVNNAKGDVVENEKKKKADAEQKIEILKVSLAKM
jgi:valyl-tRNA synthetase